MYMKAREYTTILSRKDTIKPCKTAFTKHYLSNSQFLELTNGSTH